MQTRVPKTVSAGATRTPVAPASQESTWQPQVFQSLLRSGVIQAKLTVSQPDDPLEREADQVADEVLRMPTGSPDLSATDPGIQRKCSCSAGSGHTCEKCSSEEKLQAKEAPGHTPSITPRTEAHITSLRGNGQPLPEAVRSFFEPRFGRDFSGVRIHSDSRANEAASAVQARAFTLGTDIVFGSGEYALQSSDGQRLLAHELVHVGQQGEAGRLLRKAATPAPPVASSKKVQKPSFENCSPYQRCQAVERLPAARRLVNAALGVLEPIVNGSVTSGPKVDLLTKHFHTSSKTHASTIQQRFMVIRDELSGPVRFGCHETEPATCNASDGIVGAFTGCGAGDKIDLCTNYYHLGCGAQARILVHEVAHHVPGLCVDKAYVHEPAYKTLSPEDALGNADSYAQLAFEALPGTPSCANCSEQIDLKGKQY